MPYKTTGKNYFMVRFECIKVLFLCAKQFIFAHIFCVSGIKICTLLHVLAMYCIAE